MTWHYAFVLIVSSKRKGQGTELLMTETVAKKKSLTRTHTHTNIVQLHTWCNRASNTLSAHEEEAVEEATVVGTLLLPSARIGVCSLLAASGLADSVSSLP